MLLSWITGLMQQAQQQVSAIVRFIVRHVLRICFFILARVPDNEMRNDQLELEDEDSDLTEMYYDHNQVVDWSSKKNE